MSKIVETNFGTLVDSKRVAEDPLLMWLKKARFTFSQ